MKKILLVVTYKTVNYGTVLQTYATQKMFEKLGVTVEILNMELLWHSTRKKRVIFYLKNAEIMELISRKGGVYFSKIIEKINKDYRHKLEARHREFDSYISGNLRLSTEVKDWDDASVLAGKYDAVAIGSDQVWLPSSVMTDIYTLAFVPEGQTKIAYAPSFGLKAIPRKYWEKYKQMLMGFRYLSVREESGAKIVKEVSGLSCEVTADPVYMLSRQEWLQEIPDNVLYTEPYIFVYLLGDNRWQREMIAGYANRRGLKTVAIIHLEQYIKYDECYYDVKLVDASPCDFINLIRHAEVIITDSFHGTSFSLIENKNFFAFKRYGDQIKGSTNTRMDSLFDTLHIDKARLLTRTSDMLEIEKRELEYDKINDLLKGMCESSWKFVERALR
ncbi:MAG: polysaccharide pyruvyl transferase family protein [Lachnospiraceae bacterium]|nr:polysaccharide pyruvyl transferase family protein [Lachnospiraceae bacterium]MCM1238785.1 polysaccharide pyruvyl transferase family protein [Lachnospiraceae bacterium]